MQKLRNLVKGRNSITYIIFIVLVTILSGSCKTKKYIVKTGIRKLSQEQIWAINSENKQLIDQIWIKKLRGVYIYENEELHFNSNIRIIKDSIIIISIGLDLGIEAFRAYIEKDSITIINRFHKTWYTGSISELSGKYELISSYYRLEELLLMEVGERGLDELNANKELKLKENSYCFTINEIDKKGDKGFNVEELCFDFFVGYLKRRAFSSGANEHDFSIEYSKYKELSLYVLPSEILAGFMYKGKKHKLLLNYDKWVVNEKFSTKMKISGSYRSVNRLLDL